MYKIYCFFKKKEWSKKIKKFKKFRLIAAALTVVSLISAWTLLASCAAEKPSTSTNTITEKTTDTTQDPTKVKTEDSGNKDTEENENKDNNNEEQLDNNNNQNTEENEDEINRKAQEIAKEIFNKDFWGFKYYSFYPIQFKEMDEWNNRYGPVILEAYLNIMQIPGIQEAGNKPFDFNDVAKERFKTAITATKLKARGEFTQQVKQEAKKIVQNEDNKAEAQQKAQESGVEEAKKFLENKIKQGINENINRSSDWRYYEWSQDHWNERILELATEDTGWSLFIVKNSSFKHYIEEIEKIFQKKELREAFVTYYKYATLGALDKSESITNEKVRTKAKKIVTKVFENKAFQTAFMEDGGLLRFLLRMDSYSSHIVREGIEKLNLI